MELKEIGKIKVEGGEMFLQINKEYVKGLKGLGDFSHIDVLCGLISVIIIKAEVFLK